MWAQSPAQVFRLPEQQDPPPSEVDPQGTANDASHDERQSSIEEVAKLLLKSNKKHNEAEEVKVKALPIDPYFRERKQETYEEVCTASGRPSKATKWIRAVEKT